MLKYAATIAGVALMASCAKDALDTFPSDAVSSGTVYGSVENAQKALSGAISGLGSNGWSKNDGPVSYGLLATTLVADAMGEDYLLAEVGNGWTWQTFSYHLKEWYDDDRLHLYGMWNMYYTTIDAANNLIASGSMLSGSNEGKAILGQAYALRALCYFHLAQFFARDYYYYPDDPCVPVYTEPSSAASTGNPRSSSRAVYKRITEDIEEAVRLLDEANKAGVKRSDVSQIDYYVACGIEARIRLNTHEWGLAATAAEEALKGYPMPVLSPSAALSGMNDIPALPSVMWGEVKTTDNYGMYASWQAQNDADHDGYATMARRCISEWLYNRMSKTDIRRGWWLGDFDNADYATSGQAIRYCQVKIKFKGTSWLGDYIYMRAEEMLLIAAEAYCQQGDDPQARIYLSQLMAQRDPNFDASQYSGKEFSSMSTSLKNNSLLEQIWIQRRIELWGEFGRLFDIKRQHVGFERQEWKAADNPNFPAEGYVRNRDTKNPDTYAWVLLLPLKEFDGNQALTPADQNPVGDTK